MATFDFLGLKKGLPLEEPGPGPQASGPSRRIWVIVAAADALLALACTALLVVRVTGHFSVPAKPLPPPAVKAAAVPKPKAEAPKEEPVKTEPPKVEAPKAEAKKPEPEKAAPARTPLGRPSVLATPPPARTTAPKPAAPKTPEKAAAASTEKTKTRPVPFSHADPDAKEVYLMGPFLVRSGGRKMMFKDSKGLWAATVYLNIGQTYKYRFEVVADKGKRMTPSQTVEVLPGD